MTDVQHLVKELQDALGIKVRCGVIALNMNEGKLASVETKVKMPVKLVKDVERILTGARPCG